MGKKAILMVAGLLAAGTVCADPYKGKGVPPKERLMQSITETIGRGWSYVGICPEPGGNRYTVFYGDPNNNTNIRQVTLYRLDTDVWVLGTGLVEK